MGKSPAGYKREHRYVVIDGDLFRVGIEQYKRALMDYKESGEKIKPEDYRMVKVDTKPFDLSDLSFAEANVMLLAAQERGVSQEALRESPTALAESILNSQSDVGEGEMSEAEELEQNGVVRKDRRARAKME